jgi:hypothetical protein
MNQLATKSELAKCLDREALVFLLSSCFSTLGDAKYVAVRTRGVAAVKSIVKSDGVIGIVGEEVVKGMKVELGRLIDVEKMPVIAEAMKVLLELL